MKFPPIDLKKLREIDLSRLTALIRGKAASKSSDVPAKGPVVTIGCDYGASKILLLETLKDGANLCIERFDILQRPEAGGGAVQVLKNGFQSRYASNKVRTSVKGQRVITRFVQFPKMKFEELRSALTYEAENYIPFKLDEVLLDFHIVDEGAETSKTMDVLLVAAKKEEVYGLIKDFQDAGLQIECIDVDVLASLNALEFFYPEDFKSSVGLLDVGKEVSSLSVVRDGKPRFMRDISFGGMDIGKRLRRKLGLTWPQAAKILESGEAPPPEALEALKESYEALSAELKVSLDYYYGQVAEARPLDKMIIAGGGGDSKTLTTVLQEHLGFTVQPFSAADKVTLGGSVDKNLFAMSERLMIVALGLCLR